MNRTIPAALALILGSVALAGCASDDVAESAATSASAMAKDPSASAMAKDPSASAMADDAAAMSTDGAWIDQATYDADQAKYHAAGDVVLFFNASWCPTCQATVQSLDAEGVPAGLTVVSVDYDNSNDLRKQYGVTVQHTFVQVDEAGDEQATFTGSVSGADIASQLA
ncbi:MAG: thioredoxin family protein [Candidatus Nanopelagicales bacterium]